MRVIREIRVFRSSSLGWPDGASRIECQEIMRPTPTNTTTLRSFLGFANYYGKFIPRFAERTTLLMELTKKDHRVERDWSTQYDRQFTDIKEALSSAPCLHGIQPKRPFTLQTDASNYVLGRYFSDLVKIKQQKEEIY